MDAEENPMSILFPSYLWLGIPLVIFLFKGSKHILFKVHVIILILLVITVSRPVLEESLQASNIEAKDIVIALDVSYSMKATDLSPTRYDFAKETIKALLEKNSSDNIMLIAFTTNPLLLSPPTTDHALISVALDTLNTEFILTKGTSLKKLFMRLKDINQGHKSLILMSDGGEEDNVQELIGLLEKANVTLTTLALGSAQGATVQKKDASLLKDKAGNLVISRINPLLKTLTSAANGNYLSASLNPNLTATALDNVLRSQTQNRQKVQKMRHSYLELYQLPLLIAALLFLLVHTRAVKYLLVFFTLLGFHAEASVFDGYHLQQAYEAYKVDDFNLSQTHLTNIEQNSLQSQMTLANTYYKMHDFKKAIKVYKSILSTSVNIKQQLYYNIANAYAAQGSYSKAKLYYTKTLQLGFDADARYNLKLVSTLKDKDDADVGIAHPKSQSSASSKSDSQDKEESQEEDQPSSGSGGGGENKAKEEKKKSKLLNDQTPQKQPLGSKVYELINKGYIRETQPW
jgi:Ca-activated chloride channel family protein